VTEQEGRRPDPLDMGKETSRPLVRAVGRKATTGESGPLKKVIGGRKLKGMGEGG